MRIGYARVSTSAQNLDMQVTALTDAGCEKIYSEKVSGAAHRERLQECMQYLREGDCLVIYKLDRLGRSLKVCWISSSSFRREILVWYHSGIISTLAGRE